MFIVLTTCSHEFCEYESKNFSYQYFQLMYCILQKAFFPSFEHLRKRKSKQILRNICWKNFGRFVFRKFVKTCRELDSTF